MDSLLIMELNIVLAILGHDIFKARLSKMTWHAHFALVVTSTCIWTHQFCPSCQMSTFLLKNNFF